jgi:lysozyme
MTIDVETAERIFHKDAQKFRSEVVHAVRADLEQHEFDACCSFIYNVGSPNFLGSTFLKRLNAGDKAAAAEALLWWNKPPEIISRRRGEYEQFKNGNYVARA